MILTKDKAGNRIDVENGAVMLKLINLPLARKLGDLHNGNLFVVRKPAQHIFRKFNAYGFNLALIKILQPTAKICVRQYGDKTLLTTAEEILQKGKVLNYARDGFETQIFMPLDCFNLVNEQWK